MADIKKIAVLTSGGDSSGMNACIRSVVRSAIFRGVQVAGVRYGYQGLIDGDFVDMDAPAVSGIINRGGTILYSSRSEAFRTAGGREKAARQLRHHKVDALIVIGGDGSYRGGAELHEENGIPVVGIPGTIDNDINGTEYTIGYDTAVNVATDAIDKLRDTATSLGRVFLVEVMGREAGSIALQVGIASGAEEVMIPETPTDLEATVQRLVEAKKRGKRSCIIVVAEGDEAGGAFDVAQEIEGRTGYPLRVTVLGHLQRGGPPTTRERIMASRFGLYAVDAVLAGKDCHAVGIIGGTVTYTPLADAVKTRPEVKDVDLELLKALSI